MRRINLLAASALALALAAPAYSQTATPNDSTNKPTQLERSAPADKTAPGATTPDKSASDMDKGASDKSKTMSADKATTQTGGIITQQATSQKLAETYIGMKVENPNKENVGKISDLIFDDQNRIVGAVLSVGGFLGIGDKHVGLAWNELRVQDSTKEPVAVVTLTKDQLKSAPEFKTQADLQAQQEAERRKLEQPAKPSGGTLGGGSSGNR
jgi:PRC-barrel domain